MRLIYSRERRALNVGEQFRNPRFFAGVEVGASTVEIHGHFPNIEGAYMAAGVPVEVIGGAPASPAPAVFAMGQAQREGCPGEEPIPADWRGLDWPELRSLAAKVSDEPIISKADAEAAIEAELARRADA